MASLGKERPNLKICIDNTEDADSSGESDGELPRTENDSSDDEPKIREEEAELSLGEEDEIEDLEPVDDNPGRMTIAERKKYGVYQKSYESDDEEETTRRRKEEWSKRYRVRVPESISSEIDLNKLYDSLGIKKKELEDGHNFRGIRLEAIHIRGVENMKTKEVCDYFKEYVPRSVEWIDDCSCNAVWDDVATSIRAMNALSHDQDEGVYDDSEEEEEKEEEKKKEEDEDELNLMSDDEMEVEEGEIKESKESKETKAKSERKKKYIITPPGRWRVGRKHKSKRLFLRFAMRADKKLRGAERRRKKFRIEADDEEEGYHAALGDLSEPELMEHDLPKQNARPTHVFEATPDDYDLDETFGVVATKPKKTLRPTSAYMGDGDYVGPSYEETLAMYSEAAKDRLAARERFGVTADESGVRRSQKRRHSGSESDSSDVDYEEELQTLLRQPVDKKKMRMYADDMDDEKESLRTNFAKSKASVLDARSKIEHRKLERKMNQSESGSGNDLRRKLQRRKDDHNKTEKPQPKFHNLHNLKVQIDTD